MIIIDVQFTGVFGIKEVIIFMKIEKINENQIRCTLTKQDLAERQIKLSELAYGTEKVKALFRDMMKQAAYEFGFEAEDIPLMIEAIPLSSDTIILIVTKVECPEELDTRFSKFSEPDLEYLEDDLLFGERQEEETEGADDVLGIFKKLQEEHKKLTDSDENKCTPPLDITKLFIFESLDEIIRVAHVLKGRFRGKSTLYKNNIDGNYCLLVNKGKESPELFNKVCNILSEYGDSRNYTMAREAFFEEHYKKILKEDALCFLQEL